MTQNIQSMRVSMNRNACVALAAIVLVTRPASAQVSGPAMIPTVLAQAVLGEFGDMMGGVRFVVGKTPDGWPTSLVASAPARIVGGAKLGPILSVVYEYPRQGDAIGTLESLVSKAGFTRAERTGFSSDAGFATSTSGASAHAFCGDGGGTVIQQLDSTRTTRTFVLVLVRDKNAAAACTASTRGPMDQLPLKLPIMRPPTGVAATQAGSSSGGNNFETRIIVDTTLTADELLAHYAKELSAGGWQVAPKSVVGNGAALQEVSTRDEKGETWRGVLIVLTATSQREVSLRMFRDREQ